MTDTQFDWALCDGHWSQMADEVRSAIVRKLKPNFTRAHFQIMETYNRRPEIVTHATPIPNRLSWRGTVVYVVTKTNLQS